MCVSAVWEHTHTHTHRPRGSAPLPPPVPAHSLTETHTVRSELVHVKQPVSNLEMEVEVVFLFI